MSSKPAYQVSPVDWRCDPNVRQVDVVVCTTAGTFVGHTYRTSRLRLLDALNHGFAAGGVHVGDDYIPLTEVDVYFQEGGHSALASLHISRASVLFVAERSGGQPREGANKSGKAIVAKKTLDARLCLPPYLLVGKLHSAAWAQLATSLRQDDTFVPLTKVRISPPLITGESQFNFVALNKAQVAYVAEADASASGEPAVVLSRSTSTPCAAPVPLPPDREPHEASQHPSGVCAGHENPAVQPRRVERQMTEKPLPELAEQVAQRFRSLQRGKSTAVAQDSSRPPSGPRTRTEQVIGERVGDLGANGKAAPSPEEELQAILDSTGDGIVLVDANHRILRINRTIAEASGYSQQEVRGRPLDALISPRNLPRVSSLIKKSLCGQSTETLEVDPDAGSGEALPLEIQISALRKEDEIVGAAITTRRPGGHRSRADSRQHDEVRFRNLIENASDWVWEVDAEGVFTYVSPRVKGILGYEPQEILGRTIFDLLPPREASHVTKRFAAAVAARESLKLRQIVYQDRNGRSVALETNAVPILGEDGRVRGYHGTHHDTTGLERTEQGFERNAVKLQRTIDGMIEAVTLAVEARDKHAVGHQRQVAKLAHAIICEMGLQSELGDSVRTAGLLHDVGKIFVPIEMLTKPGALTEDEFATIRSHPGAGYEILKNLELPWPVAEIILQHHERMNGSGYPLGLQGDEIRLEARVLGVADTIEAMLHPRSYRSALSLDHALREIANDKGVLYDKDVVEACLSAILDRGFRFQSE